MESLHPISSLFGCKSGIMEKKYSNICKKAVYPDGFFTKKCYIENVYHKSTNRRI